MDGLLPRYVFLTSFQPVLRIYTIESGTDTPLSGGHSVISTCDESVPTYSKTIGSLFFLITVAMHVPSALVTYKNFVAPCGLLGD